MIERIRESSALERAPNVTNRHVAIAFGARFYDELMGGIPAVLMPTIQAQLGLSLTQVGLLRTVLDYVSAFVEPINGLLIDVLPRKWMMGVGAILLGLSITTIGLAWTFGLLVVGYIIFGMGSGPLAHTGDVVVVEAYPTEPDRAFARSTLIDTMGALLAPLLVTLFFWQEWPWRWLMFSIGGLGLLYGCLILWNGLPSAQGKGGSDDVPFWPAIRDNLKEVLTDRAALKWLLLLFLFELMELPAILKTIWLVQEVGMSQALVGVYVMAEMAVGLISLVALDFWRKQSSVGRVLRVITPAVALLFPLWLLLPGVWARFVLMVPLNFFFAMFWPILKGNLLASMPGKAGSVTAVRSLQGLIPLALLFGLLADQVGMTTAMLAVHSIAVVVLWWLIRTE